MRQLRRLVSAMTVTAMGVVLPIARAWADDVVPDAPPDASAPGGNLVKTAIGWLKYGALSAAIVGLLIGGVATGVGHFGSNYSASSAGKKWLLGGMGAAMIAGLAHAVALAVYNGTS